MKNEKINFDSALDDNELDRLLREDVPFGDLTTDALGIGSLPGKISFVARAAMRVCGTEEAARMFERAGCCVRLSAPRGVRVVAGALLLEAEASAAALHRVWKTAQTLVEYASGIASAAAQIVEAAGELGKRPRVVCSRKNFPGTRAITTLAIRAGGAIPHRLGLSETLLVFDEHRVFIAPTALNARLAAVKRDHPEKKLMVEVIDAEEGLRFAAAGADIIQLEKFSPQQVSAFVASVNDMARRPLVAAAGGVNAGNAAAYAASGADILVTSAPYFAIPADVKVVLTP